MPSVAGGRREPGAGHAGPVREGRILAKAGLGRPRALGTGAPRVPAIVGAPTAPSASRRAGCAPTAAAARWPSSSTARSSARRGRPAGSALILSRADRQQSSAAPASGAFEVHAKAWANPTCDRRGLVGGDRSRAGLQLVPGRERDSGAVGQAVVRRRHGHRRIGRRRLPGPRPRRARPLRRRRPGSTASRLRAP